MDSKRFGVQVLEFQPVPETMIEDVGGFLVLKSVDLKASEKSRLGCGVDCELLIIQHPSAYFPAELQGLIEYDSFLGKIINRHVTDDQDGSCLEILDLVASYFVELAGRILQQQAVAGEIELSPKPGDYLFDMIVRKSGIVLGMGNIRQASGDILEIIVVIGELHLILGFVL